MSNKPFEIQSPSLSLNGVNIDTSAQGKLVIPGITRAGTSVAIEVNDTGDQTQTWTGTPVVIDGYSYEVYVTGSNGGQIGFTPATYAINALDGEGYIDGISVVTGGAGYTGEAVTLSQVMWAAPEGTPIDSSGNNGTTWIQIPFAVRCGAGEIESEFGGGGASLGNLTVTGDRITSSENYIQLFTGDGESTYGVIDSNIGMGNYAEMYVQNDNDGPNTAYAWVGTTLDDLSNPRVQVKVQRTDDGTTHHWEFNKDGLMFPDNTVQTTAYTGQNGGTPASPLPSWLTVVSGTQHLPYLNTDYGWDSNGVWTTNATIGQGGAGPGFEGTSYPIRLTTPIAGNLKTVVTVDFVVNEIGADFGIGVWATGQVPNWQWDGTSGDPYANRIGAQYDGPAPELHGITGGAGDPESNFIPGPGTYRARLTITPTDPGVADIMLETLDTSDNVLSTIGYTEELFPNLTTYNIGFASDQDNGSSKTYFKNLTINIDNGATVYTDPLTSYSSVLSAGVNVLVNENQILTLDANGAVTFPDGTVQYTAYPALPGSSPTLVDSATEVMSDGTQTGVYFTAAPLTVIVVASSCETFDNNGAPATITSIVGMGLTWHKRSGYTDPTSDVGQRSEIWYAVNDTNSAISDIITITFNTNVDDQTTIISSYSGCNLGAPWTVSGPSYSNSKNGINATVTMNIAEPNTAGIVFFAIPNYGNSYEPDGSIPGYATGWTGVAYSDNGGGEFYQFSNLSYKQFADPQLNLAVVGAGDLTWNGNGIGLTVIADALIGTINPLDRIGKNGHALVIESDGRLTLGDGASILGRVNDDDLVLWTDDTAEYVGLWYGGITDVTSDDYGPVSSFSIGNTQNDDLYRGPGNGGNTNKNWDDGPQANLDLGEKNWHFDGVTGDLTLPAKGFKGSFTTLSSNDNYNFWFNSSVTGPDGTVYAVGGEDNQSERWVVAHGTDGPLWKKRLSSQDLGDGYGSAFPQLVNIKYSTQHDLLYAGFNSGDSTGVISIVPSTGAIDNSWVVRLSTDDSASVEQYAFTIDADGTPIIAGRSSGGYITHNNVTGTQGIDLDGNPYLQVNRTAIGDLNNTFRWNSGEYQLDRYGDSSWASPIALDTYFNVPVSYLGGSGTGGLHTAVEGTEYNSGAITGYDGYGIDVDASLWNDQTMLGSFLAKGNGDHFTVIIGSLTPGVDQTVYTFSSVSDFSVPAGTVYHMDGNWTKVSGTQTLTTSTDILSVTYGTVKTYNVSSGVYSSGQRVWYSVEQNQQGYGYQTGDQLRIPGSLLGGVDSTIIHSAIPLAYRDGNFGAFRMFIDLDAYPELYNVTVNTTVNFDSVPGVSGYVTNVSSDDNSRRWVFTVTTDLSGWVDNQGMTVTFVTGNDLVFTLDQWGYATQQTGVPAADSYRIVMNQAFGGNSTTFTSVGGADYTLGDFVFINDSAGSGNCWLKVSNIGRTNVTDHIGIGSIIVPDSNTLFTLTVTGTLDTIPVFGGVGYLVTGGSGIGDQFTNFVQFTVNNGTYNIRRIEGQQAFIWSNRWAHTYGTINNGEQFDDVAYDPVNDTVYATGDFNDTGSNSNCLILALNNTNGTVKWQKFVGDANNDNYGNSSSIGVTPSGDVIAIGENDNSYAMITKLYGGDGSVVWQTIQSNQSNWNTEPTGAVDTNGNVYFGGSYYNNDAGRYIVQLTKLTGSNGTPVWSRNIATTDNRDFYDQYNNFQQCINVGGGQVQWGSYVYDQYNNYYDAISISIPQDGSGTDTYGRWVYSEDNYYNSTINNSSFVQDPATPFAPTDALTAELTQPSMTWDDQYIIYAVTRINISSGLPGIVFADGSEIDQAGISKAFKDTGDNYTLLDFEHNGKFIYFAGNVNGNGNSTIQIPQNYDRELPIGYTVTLILDDFDGYNVYVNTGGNTDNGLRIGAVGFSQTYSNDNYWRIGDDGNTGIYTIMKVDTNRWILSGPSIADDL